MSEELVEQRNLDVIVAEIRALTGSMLNAVIEIGRRMVEAKEMLPYGEFGEWVKVNTGYSHTTAANFMKLFNEYGNKQLDMFGNRADSYIGRLNYSKALELLALPEPEREEFAEAVSADGLTVKELKAEIKKWKEKAERADEHSMKAEDYGEKAERRAEEAEQRAENAEQELRELKSKPAEIIVQEPDEAEIKKRVADQLAKAEQAHQKKLAELDERARKAEKAEAEAKAKAEEIRDTQAKELAEAKAKAEEAEKRAALAQETANMEVEQLRKQLAMSDPVIAEFKGLFGQCSELSAKLVALVAKAPAEQAEKMRKALAAVAKQLTEV